MPEVGTKDAFAQKHFCSYLRDGEWSDEIEDEWRWRENVSLPAVRRLIAGGRAPEDREAVKILAAIHYVRSYAFVEALHRITADMEATKPGEIAATDGAIAAFEHDFHRPPEPGEIEDIVLGRFADLRETRAMLVGEMAEDYNKTLAMLEPFHVQLIWPQKSGAEFLLGDVPLVHSNKDGRIGTLGGLALGNADQAFLPLGPRLAAALSVRPLGDGGIPRETVELLNRKTWDVAMRLVAAHPATNVKRSTLQWGIKIDHATSR